MRTKNSLIGMFSIIFLVGIVAAQITGAAVVVDSGYLTIYPGEEGTVKIEIENTGNTDIEDVSIQLLLNDLPFTSIGSSEREIDEIREDKDDDVSFKLKTSTDATPGDYNIPYIVTYKEQGGNTTIEKEGSFGLRISAKTDIDFSVEAKGANTNTAIVGQQGQISLEIINKGFGELKSVSVQVFPQGYELISKDKIFVGTVSAEDSDIINFDVIFKTSSPTLSAKITYKDFENSEQSESINLPLEVYTRERALGLGLIQEDYTWVYALGVLFLFIAWIVYRKIKKRRRKNRT